MIIKFVYHLITNNLNNSYFNKVHLDSAKEKNNINNINNHLFKKDIYNMIK
jgi:hypothetical protein